MSDTIPYMNLSEKLEKLHPQIASVLLFSLAPDLAGMILSSVPLGFAFELSERIIETEVIDLTVFTEMRSMVENLYPDYERLSGNKKEILSSALEYTEYLSVTNRIADPFVIGILTP